MPQTDLAFRMIRSLLLAAALPLGAAFAEAAPAAADQRATACEAADAPAGPRLSVTVNNARNATGKVVVTLYGSDPRAFLEQRIALAEAPVRDGSARVCFALSAAGDYAISVFHDENGDGILNRTLIGLPEEGFGFSNDAPVRLGPPSFSAARVAVPAGSSATAIRLRYF